MRLLIVFPGALFPILGMSQVRALNQVKRLAQDHEVCFADIVSRAEQQTECRDRLAAAIASYRPVLAASYGKGRLWRIIRFGWQKLRYQLSILSLEEITLSAKSIDRQLQAIVDEFKPEGVIIHYWYLGRLFGGIFGNLIRMIDTHYVVEENIELLSKYRYSPLVRLRMQHELKHSLKMQNRYFSNSELIIVNSARQAEIIKTEHPDFNTEVTVNGQEIDELLNYRTDLEADTILFYGALSNQFNRLGLETLLAKIYPVLKQSISGLKLYVVGNNPPQDIISRYKDDNIIVTGYVEDIKPYVARCCLMLLPLQTGSGFRGRAVEVMALGVPIIGTANALQSLELESGKEGYILESPETMAEHALKVLKNKELRQSMSEACRTLCAKKYSIEATFGRLSEKISLLGKQRAGNV